MTLVTTDNPGVLPPMVLAELIPIIDGSRPFMASTRQLDAPVAGMGMTIPLVALRPTAGRQPDEKRPLTATGTFIERFTAELQTIGGYGDASLQLLIRSDPSYLVTYVALLAEAYGVEADARAISALLDEPGAFDGGTFDPDDFRIGPAIINAAARRMLPNRLWLSTAGVAAFVNAKTPQGELIYPDGIEGPISGLRPVYVPALDDTGTDALVGPSRGFSWAQDGTYTLQAVRPAEAGRDIGLVGFVWMLPHDRGAFTRYALES